MAPKICTLLSYFSQLLYKSKTYVSVQIFNSINIQPNGKGLFIARGTQYWSQD